MIFGYDIDRVFSYTTDRIVIIGDKKLAVISYFFLIAILIYIIVYHIVILESYKEVVQGNGNKLDNCGGKNCDSDDDCLDSPPTKFKSCMSGRCKTFQWCPTLATGEDQATQSHYMGVDNLAIKLVGTMDFLPLTNSIFYSTYTRDNIFYPDRDANTYRIRDLFEMADLNFSFLKDTGGVFEIIMDWDCDVGNSKCIPNLKVKFMNQTNSINPLSQPLGFFVEKSYELEGQRQYILNVGLKFILVSRGIAKAFNLYNLIIQFAMYSMFAIFTKGFVDIIMVNCCLKNKKKYARYKYIDSDDFSDLKEGLEPVKREREEQKKKNEILT